LQKSNRELQKAQDDHCLHDVQRLLGLEIFSTEEHERNWDKHGHTLSFDDCLNAFQQMKGSELDAFRASDHYRTWISSEEACLLILSGHNDQSILYGTDQCWLSPVAIAAVNDLSREKSRNVYSYYTFPRDRQLIYGVLPIILLQLLRQKSHALRDGGRYDELCAELHKFREYRQLDEPAEKQRDDMVSTIEKAALRVIDFFEQSEVVYIIIDRADRCWSSSRIDHRYLFLKTLVKMVEAARSKLRVLVIIDGSSWQVQKHRDELGENTNGRVIIHTAHQGESGP